MRDYTGIAYASLPNPDARDFTPRVRQFLSTIDYFLRDVSAGMGRIQKGQSPDGSGTTIGVTSHHLLTDLLTFDDHTQYFLLAGRDSNQTAYGGTTAAGSLTLASTSNATKGLIYFGFSQTSAYDETQDFLGIGTAAPAARLHANTASLGTAVLGALGTTLVRLSYGGTTNIDIAPLLNTAGVVDLAFNVNSGSVQFLDSSQINAGLRIAFSGTRSFLQAGRLNSSGNAINNNLTIGGMNAVVGDSLILNSNTTFFDSSGIGATGITKIGIGRNPLTFGPGASTAPDLYLRAQASAPGGLVIERVGGGDDSALYITQAVPDGVSPNFTPSVNYVFRVTSAGRMYLSNAAGSFWYARSVGNVTSIFDSADLNRLAIGTVSSWSDAVSSHFFQMGDLISGTGRRVVLDSSGNVVLQRFGVSSLHTLISTATSTAAAFLAPSASPEVLRVLNDDTNGVTGSVVLEVRGRTGQTGNLTNWNVGGSTLASVDANGVGTFGGMTTPGTGLIINTNAAASRTILAINDTDTGQAQGWVLDAAIAGSVTLTFPAVGGTVATSTNTATLANKTLNTSNKLLCNTGSGVSFQDGSTPTKQMRFDLVGITAATVRNKKWQDDASTICEIVAPTSATVDKTAQTATINATTAYTTVHAGNYRMSAYAVFSAVTVPGNLTIAAIFTDPVQAQTVTVPTFNTAGAAAVAYTVVGSLLQGECEMRCTAGSTIQFSATLTGTGTYNVYIRVESLT